MAARIRIGISGWRYAPWRGEFYPDELAQRDELRYASRMFSSIELNGSFYSLQKPAHYAQWRDDTPEDFVFSVKGSRYITHVRRLKDVEVPLANFFASGVLELGDKLGPFLWQFPPRMRFDAARFEAFFKLLPRDTAAAAALARHHDARVDGRCSIEAGRRHRLRHAVEIRDASFVDERFIGLLRRHRIALVVADTAGKWPLLEDLCADFMYLRLHGDKELYASGYTSTALRRWSERISVWSRGEQVHDAHLASKKKLRARRSRDVYCYFDNDVKVRAPFDAASLARRLKLDSPLGRKGRPSWPKGWTPRNSRRDERGHERRDSA